MYQSYNGQSTKCDEKSHVDVANQNYHKSDPACFFCQPMMDDGMEKRRDDYFEVLLNSIIREET